MAPLSPDEPTAEAQREERRRFHMQACLGRGGFGEVYRALMISAGGVKIEVVAKVLHTDSDARAQDVRRLHDEAQLQALLNHPVILKVHDLCLLSGRVALITEYVEGQDLDKLIYTEDPITPRCLIELVAAVAGALHTAWTTPNPETGQALHLIHRDIKPSNLRVGQHGQVKLLDFGIARADGKREAKTENGSLLGSYLYMGPERFLEDEVEVTCATDVFALGCTLYEGLCQERLFEDMSLHTLYGLVLHRAKFEQTVADRLARLPGHLDDRIRSLLEGMLHYEPAERPWPSELARLCEEIADDLPGRSLPRWARARHWPGPASVQGILDGAVLTAASLTDSQPLQRGGSRAPAPLLSNPTLERPSATEPDRFVVARPTRAGTPQPVGRERPRPSAIPAAAPPPDATARAMVTPSRAPAIAMPAPPGVRPQPLPTGAVSRTLATPQAKVAIGVALGGTAGVLIVGAIALLALGMGVYWWSRPAPAPAPTPPPAIVAPAPAKPQPAPAALPTAVAPAAPQPLAAPAASLPVPAPAPAPVAAPVALPEPLPSPAPPAPTVAPAPAPAPAPNAVDPASSTSRDVGMVAITGGVPTELRAGGTVRRPGQIPAGTYEVWADVDGVGELKQVTTFRLDPGARVLVACSKLRRECHVQ